MNSFLKIAAVTVAMMVAQPALAHCTKDGSALADKNGAAVMKNGEVVACPAAATTTAPTAKHMHHKHMMHSRTGNYDAHQASQYDSRIGANRMNGRYENTRYNNGTYFGYAIQNVGNPGDARDAGRAVQHR